MEPKAISHAPTWRRACNPAQEFRRVPRGRPAGCFWLTWNTDVLLWNSDLGRGNVGRLVRGSLHQLDQSFREFLPYVNAIRNPDQIGVFKFDAGPRVAVIEQYVVS